MMILILLLILLVYVVTIAQLIVGFDKIKTTHFTQSKPKTFFAIVVPFRNESANLPILLESIKNLNYPKELFEIILIDDFSEDDSVRQVYNWRMENGVFQTTLLENIRLSNSPKKDAISRAIPIVKKEWLVTTDADCVVPENWLMALDQYIQQYDVEMIVGSVVYDCKKSFLHYFQQLDLISLQGATIGSFGMGLGFLCNGANFCYTKSMFEKLHGFKGNNQMASGDDVFLLQKAMHEYPEKVHFLKSKETIVHTKPTASWTELFSQRVRWASKAGSYQSVFGRDLAVIVFGGNLALVVGCMLAVFGWSSCAVVGILFGLKFVVDCILLYKANRFLRKKRMRYLLMGSLLYPFFCVVVAVFSWFGKYEWKGRRF
ncbi:glycosyltransferase [Flavobacterium sp.]|uniref:glycosyltransferase n=1 Tax=Flavobacterium sp. TaxID=239 RepID=UPI00286B3332|nr:glycosyltransferase [Flavobacterium sp.]